MQPRELINRTTNLLATVLIGITGFAFAPEIFGESDWADKSDDILLFVLAVVAIFWYNKGKNRFQRTVMPVILTGLGLAIKIMAIAIEFHDADNVGDDIGGVIVFLISFIIVWWLYKKYDKGLVDGQTTNS